MRRVCLWYLSLAVLLLFAVAASAVGPSDMASPASLQLAKVKAPSQKKSRDNSDECSGAPVRMERDRQPLCLSCHDDYMNGKQRGFDPDEWSMIHAKHEFSCCECHTSRQVAAPDAAPEEASQCEGPGVSTYKGKSVCLRCHKSRKSTAADRVHRSHKRMNCCACHNKPKNP